MIPASYLYKDVYRQTWIDPDVECAKARASVNNHGHHIWSGLISLAARLVGQRPTYRPVPAHRIAFDCP